jgi:superfamily II RNA helicase
MRLVDALPEAPSADALYEAFGTWAHAEGIELYPHQEEAAIELFDGKHVVLATPTGSGKSLVAVAAHAAALARGERTFYTAPIKALVSEKFFALCATFGADRVGMLTGDAAVNSDAPIICCTAEVLANMALREGAQADVGQVVMDEFHFYADGQRGWAWQVPLLTLPQAQFLLMSATLGDVSRITEDLAGRTGREVAVIDDAERPVPLTWTWSTDPLHELLEELVRDDRAPIYVVHFTQASALERAQALVSAKLTSRDERDAIADALGAFRFTKGFGKTLSRLVRAGIGVHHAGMLPRYRRLVEQLAQQGLLKVICGTDTLGVGINVPIRTVVLTALAKYDGSRHRILKARELHQIAGRAGRAGFDTTGHVVVQAPEHVIERQRAVAKAAEKGKKAPPPKKAPEGVVSWTEETYEKLRTAQPEALTSKLRVEHGTILNVVQQPGDQVAVMRDLIESSHEDDRGRARLLEQAQALGDELVAAGVLEWLPEPDREGRVLALAVDLQENFALDQPLASFALGALDALEPEDPLDVVSVIEAILDDPFPVLRAQADRAKTEAVAAMKAEGIEYEERMARLEEITYPRPLAEELDLLFREHRASHPWVRESDLSPKSVVRDMVEAGRSFSETIAFYGLSRSEGLVLRYLSDAYRALRRTLPESRRTEELETLIDWLGETIRQTDSSLLDEWEALTDPEAAERAAAGEPPPPPRPVTGNERAFTVMVRNAMFQRVQLAAQDAWAVLAELDDGLTAEQWEAALGRYWDEHDSIGTGPQARSPQLLLLERGDGVWRARQIIDDPAGHHDWAITATVDLDASDEAGEAVVRVEAFSND